MAFLTSSSEKGLTLTSLTQFSNCLIFQQIQKLLILFPMGLICQTVYEEEIKNKACYVLCEDCSHTDRLNNFNL